MSARPEPATLPLRWRTAPDEAPTAWRTDSTAWTGTVADVRRALAPTCGSDVALAAEYAPELWLCDESGALSKPKPPVGPARLLTWTNTTCGDARLLDRYANGTRKAFVLFTFPPADASAAPSSKRARTAAAPEVDWAAIKADTLAFFRRLDDPATLRPDADGYVALPQHPSMAMSSRRRFDVVAGPGGQATVPLLSRALAREYATAIREQCTATHNFLYIHGAQGVGKSYALYEAVCRLMAQRAEVRVIYLHDCSGWDNDAGVAVQQLAAVVASGFRPAEDAAIWTDAEAVRTYGDLHRLLDITVPAYCRQHGLIVAAVFDQHNGLRPDLRTQLPWKVPEGVLPSLASWKGLSATVISASANNEYYLKVAVDAAWRRLDCFHGFSDAELRQWRRHHKFFDTPKHADAWSDVKALVNNWPLDLNDMRMAPAATLAETLEQHRRQRLRVLSYHESRHLENHVRTDPEKQRQYAGVVLEMLVGRPDVTTRYVRASDIINKHVLFHDKATDSVRPIHDLARQLYLAEGYLKRAGDLADTTVKDVLSSALVTADSKGRMLELYVANCMEAMQTFELMAQRVRADGTLGKEARLIAAKALTTTYFPTQGVPPLSWAVSALFVPLNSSYPGLDLLLWDAHERVLVAIQVTVGAIKNHKATLTPRLEAAWIKAANARQLRYAWLAPAAEVTPAHAGHYYVSLASLQGRLAPLVAHYVATG